MPKTVAIHQPNFLPWIGYFYKMANCDVFVILDDAKHSKSSPTNKNKIKTPNGIKTLSVPLSKKEVAIKEVTIFNDGQWNKQHWRIIYDSYRKAPYFEEYSPIFEKIYNAKWDYLCELNIEIIKIVKQILKIKSQIIISSELQVNLGSKSERNMNICKFLGGDVYLSGTGARKYNDEDAFLKAGIKLEYTDFKHPIYPQLWGDFVPNLSVVDLLFNCGAESKKILLGDK